MPFDDHDDSRYSAGSRRGGLRLRPRPLSHPKVRPANRLYRPRGTGYLYPRRNRPAEEVQQKFARSPAEQCCGFGGPHGHPLVGSRPVDLKSCAVQPAAQIAARLADVSPQRLLHRVRQGVAWAEAVRSTQILVMDEVLVQVGKSSNPADAEESTRRPGPDPSDEPLECSKLGQFRPASFGEPLEQRREDETRARDEV